MSENSRESGELFPGSENVPREELLEASCSRCHAAWLVHRDLSGFRVKCRDCGEMISVPEKEDTRVLPVIPASLNPETRRPDKRLTIYRRKKGLGIEVRGDLPEDGLDEVEALDIRKPLLNRAFGELILILAAFLVPHLLLIFLSTGSRRMFYHPVSTLSSSLLILLIVILFSPETFRDIKLPRARYFGEAAAATAGFLLLAWMLQQMAEAVPGYNPVPFDGMKKQWGTAWIIVMIGVGPGIFEELAFRGLLQSRFDILYGSRMSVYYTGIAFALCHGVTLAFPVHVGIGIYLCSLRNRSGNLLPGMILHIAYNTLVVTVL